MSTSINRIRGKEALIRLGIITSIFTGIGSIIASNIHWVTHAGVGFHTSTQPAFILYLIPPTHLFGLIVTDPNGKNIISYSGKNSSTPISWRAALNPEELKNPPYDLLLDPPAIFPQSVYANPRATERTANPFSTSGWIQSYAVAIIATIVMIILMTLEHTLAREREKKLQENNRKLQIDLAEKIQERELQQVQIDSQRSEFEQEIKQLHNKIGLLNQSIAQLQSQCQNESFELQNKLREAQLQSQQNLNQQQEYENRIELLTQQLIEEKHNQSQKPGRQILIKILCIQLNLNRKKS
ncbi:hypothetical protein CEP10_04690 [Cylindrospermopsis raciborskii S07]|uniref:Uncharacterized protein n=3 Tax=Cylindrospermopsis raciborskii TaxID=77022 RepID=A0A853MCL0_9CYAN|nr:hypothetical protein [Cylindrospermopsis raciborskii]EFA69091.1 hypothetical protein CRC_02452 [Cylindrospermopsis raciborskii CS-505]MBA4446023.1 hypothetical protein [Cylindrospermopsis raciborskii CS-506_C]MBA4450253.1 hypothetical protein [Cylindrospermopsis raciborskii CS-506_D]MBA4456877.1 hypothetical protein [Cylindrospermopsis raciborskii CS-506_B]MBA4466234.1 hypothetical protein [Cylindrospermopsis raciborskii CS-506_A]